MSIRVLLLISLKVGLKSYWKYEPHHDKNLLLPYVNNLGADQPAQPGSLISAFVVRFLDSIIPLLAKSKIS